MNNDKKDKISYQAKEIMDNFMKSLNKLEIKNDFQLKRENSYRIEEKEVYKLDNNFKQIFLSNANKISGDAILANKGSWVEQ